MTAAVLGFLRRLDNARIVFRVTSDGSEVETSFECSAVAIFDGWVRGTPWDAHGQEHWWPREQVTEVKAIDAPG